MEDIVQFCHRQNLLLLADEVESVCLSALCVYYTKSDVSSADNVLARILIMPCSNYAMFLLFAKCVYIGQRIVTRWICQNVLLPKVALYDTQLKSALHLPLRKYL